MEVNDFIPGNDATFLYNGEVRTGRVETVRSTKDKNVVVTLFCEKRQALRDFRLDRMAPLPEVEVA